MKTLRNLHANHTVHQLRADREPVRLEHLLQPVHTKPALAVFIRVDHAPEERRAVVPQPTNQVREYQGPANQF